jgi:hypothetical protein
MSASRLPRLQRPRRIVVLLAALVAGASAGCGDEATSPPTAGSTGGGGSGGGETGSGGVATWSGCPAGTKPEGDACLEPGVPSDACGNGFAWADGGCDPVLPSAPCPAGQMALPGETECRAVADCGDGRWGNIPLESDTIYVDASYTGGNEDGSEAAPFTSIDWAVGQAQSGRQIAVAAGSYPDDIAVQNKQVRIWGRCPELVEVAGEVDREMSSLIVGAGADGSEFHGLAFTGPDLGVVLSGSEDLLLERVWIHHTGRMGLASQQDLGTTSFTLRDSLIEQLPERGVYVVGAAATIEGTVVRDIAPTSTGTDGEGIAVGEDDQRAVDLVFRHSIIERTHDAGLLMSGGTLLFEDSLVRDVAPQAADGTRGRGLAMQADAQLMPLVAEVRRSAFIGNHEYSVYVWSAEALVEHVTVRDTKGPNPDRLAGIGVAAIHAPGAAQGAQLTLRQSLVERNEQMGVHVSGSQATLEQVLVRDNLPASNQRFGRGIQIQDREEVGASSTVTVRWSKVLRSYESGILVVDSSATIEDTLVEGTLPTQADGNFGDGIDVIRLDSDTLVDIVHSRIDGNARVGLANFGAAASLGASWLDCNTIQLNGETLSDVAYSFDNRGGNRCGCGGEEVECKVLSLAVSPPDVLFDD